MNLLSDMIVSESQQYAQAYSRYGAPPRVKTFYLGGGTPSNFSPDALQSMMARIAATWGWESMPPEEVAIEANPEDVTPRFLSSLEGSGVTRLSLGVQTFQDRLLQVLRRPVSATVVETALKNIREFPWKHRPLLNVDLILGIPGQNLQDLREDLERLLHWDPDHVSAYGLSIEPGTALHTALARGKLTSPDQDLAEDLWEYADSWLEDHGWKNYEISNYARPGAESRHNIRYWEMRPWLGLGPGASGTLPAWHGGQVWPHRRKNPQLSSYGPEREDFFQTGETEWIDRGNFFLDYLITSLRLSKGIAYRHLDEVFQVDTKKVLAPWLEELDRRGYLCFSETRLRLNRRGRFVLDRLLVLGLDLFRRVPEIVEGPPPRWPTSDS